jgi:hypothetical protein
VANVVITTLCLCQTVQATRGYYEAMPNHPSFTIVTSPYPTDGGTDVINAYGFPSVHSPENKQNHLRYLLHVLFPRYLG